MKVFAAPTFRFVMPLLLVFVITGCDDVARVASGVGNSISEKLSNDDSPPKGSGGTQQPASNGVGSILGDSTSSDDAEPAEDTGETQNPTSDDDSQSDGGDGQANNENETETPSGRNIEQYPRLQRNVTWKPISSSAGDNLTIVLWGNGGGEKNYEQGSLRVEHNDGVKYPRTYVRRDDPDNHERAPKFYFDVQGSWFKGKDPVLFWNLGAYRVVNPERRQGKNEE